MKTTTKQSLIALSLSSALFLFPTLVRAEKGGGSGGILQIAMMYSTINSSPISIVSMDNSVIIDINTNLGDIIVDVMDESGFVVYSELVDTSSHSQIAIDIADFTSGTYFVTVINIEGDTIAEDILLH